VATTKNTGGQLNFPTENAGSLIDTALIPEGGIAIFIAGSLKPYYLTVDRELIIGRKTEKVTSGSFLDLSDLDGFNMGLSRRHALIRRTDSGYEIIDLSSTNGTWLNNERLIPNRCYPFASGSQLRAGRMRLFIFYQPVLVNMKKKLS
jgi:FHA domain